MDNSSWAVAAAVEALQLAFGVLRVAAVGARRVVAVVPGLAAAAVARAVE